MKYITGILVIITAVAADVSHLPSNEYLPPGSNHVSSAVHYPAPVSRQYLAPVQAAPEHHVQVAHVAPEHHASVGVSNDYLPPLSNTVEEAKPAHEVHDDGYVYKNPVEERRAKRRYRLRYRTRRY